MLNINDIKNATIAQLKQFATENNLVVQGDRRLRATWERAIELFLSVKETAIDYAQETVNGAIECIQEAITYDNAVLAANWVYVQSKAFVGWMLETGLPWAMRAVWAAILVAIALVGEAIDLWRDEDGIREQVFSLVKERVTEAWGRRREAGATILEMRIGQSVRELKASWRDEQPDQLAKHLARLTDEEVNRLTHELDQMVVDAEIAAALQEEAPF